MQTYFVDPGEGEVVDLGVVRMRLIVASPETNGSFSVAEFRGSEGPWTVPHVHRRMEESFYVLDGTFEFMCDDREFEARTGAYVLVPRGMRHVMRAGPGGGALLTLFVPGGLEEMFRELGGLSGEKITDPDVRAEIGKRHDSVPV
jgi:quercetin dioxygenase-like cupin family protein